MNNDKFEQNVVELFSIPENSRELICECCGQPIVVCNRCRKTKTGKFTCAGKGFIHITSLYKLHIYLPHTCDYTIEWKLDTNGNKMNGIAFPILTPDEIKRVKHYNEGN